MTQQLDGENVIYSGHPSWRSMLTFHGGVLLAAVVAAAIAWLATGWDIAVPLFILLFAVGVFIGFVRRVATLYTITDRRLHIRRGLLSRNEQHTTIDRVQNVNTRQSIVERMLAIGTVDFDTAGTDDSDFVFEGVASPRKVVAAVDEAQKRAGVTPV